jgi:hypothetical protein
MYDDSYDKEVKRKYGDHDDSLKEKYKYYLSEDHLRD